MDPVKIRKMGAHTMVTGSNRAAVERAVQDLVTQGARLVSKVEALGDNWIATLEQRVEADDDGCKVVRLGMQIIVTGPDRQRVQARLDAILGDGAVLKSGPQQREDQWVAVCDEAGVDKTVHRW
jgi:hypothetical protein